MAFDMTDELWIWVGVLGLLGIVAVCLAIHFRTQRWPRVIAVTAGGAIVSILVGEPGAVDSILLTGLILTVGSAAGNRQ
jgi:hypothetical protein